MHYRTLIPYFSEIKGTSTYPPNVKAIHEKVMYNGTAYWLATVSDTYSGDSVALSDYEASELANEIAAKITEAERELLSLWEPILQESRELEELGMDTGVNTVRNILVKRREIREIAQAARDKVLGTKDLEKLRRWQYPDFTGKAPSQT